MSDYSFIIVAYSLTALAAIYMISYYFTLFSNCSKFPELTQAQLVELTQLDILTQDEKYTLPPEKKTLLGKIQDTITRKECCEGTWGSITSSVQLTLYILAGALIVMYMIFYWGQTGEFSIYAIIALALYFGFIGMYTLLRDFIKVNIFR